MATNRIIPDFFIVGAPKAGTTALHAYLDHHPQVSMSSDKEPNFFSWEEIESQNLYYTKKNVKTKEEYLSLFTTNTETKVYGEGSISYLFYPKVADRIKAYNPQAKILISLRHPVKRAFSHYQMDYSLGLVNIPFKTIWKQGRNHPDSGIFFQQYFELSMYHPQVERYLAIFDRSSIFLMLHDEMVQNSEEVIERLCRFLEIKFIPEMSEIKQQNVTTAGKNSIIRGIYKNEFLRKALAAVTGEKVKQLAKQLFFSKSALPSLEKDLETELNNYYKQDLEKLKNLTGLSINHWINKN
jgi:hypothetical protein